MCFSNTLLKLERWYCKRARHWGAAPISGLGERAASPNLAPVDDFL
jgi:hypothetical protein